MEVWSQMWGGDCEGRWACAEGLLSSGERCVGSKEEMRRYDGGESVTWLRRILDARCTVCVCVGVGDGGRGSGADAAAAGGGGV